MRNPRHKEIIKLRKIEDVIQKIALFLTLSYMIFYTIYQRNEIVNLKYLLEKGDSKSPIEKLDEASKNLKELQLFIDGQKERIIQQEKLLHQLADEKEKLEPVVTAQKEAIETILRLQEKRLNFNFLNILMGFSIGVFSSIVGSILFNKLQKEKKRDI